MMRSARWSLAAWLLLALAPLAGVADDHSGTVPLGREQLLGSWRLKSITRITSQGAESDPFYGDHCSGLLIYDRAGWMSVQIVGNTRPPLSPPEARDSGMSKDARRKSAAFDAYYAYFGTWGYDAARGTVTHTIVASLYPAEQGLAYTQEVRLRGAQMIFTVRHRSARGETREVKIWERVKPAD